MVNLKKYVRSFILAVIGFVLLFGLFNYTVDPYMLFMSTRFQGVNEKKPTAINRSALYKLYNIKEIKPETVIIGNSRPEMGINTNSVCWSKKFGKVYSLTFPGLGTYAHARALFHAIAVSDVKHIFMAVDFADFLGKKSEATIGEWPKKTSDFYQRMDVDQDFRKNDDYSWRKLSDFGNALFSTDAINDSILTVLKQSSNSPTRTRMGYNPANDYREIINFEGQRVLFDQTLVNLNNRFSKKNMSVYGADKWSLEYEAVKKAIELANKKNIKITIFINPYHYTYLDKIKEFGYWNEFEKFKKRLKEVVITYNEQQVELWDFALYSPYTMESVPNIKGKNSNLRWFWEPAHYKAEMGDIMLAEMLASNCVDTTSGKFGIRLDSK